MLLAFAESFLDLWTFTLTLQMTLLQIMIWVSYTTTKGDSKLYAHSMLRNLLTKWPFVWMQNPSTAIQTWTLHDVTHCARERGPTTGVYICAQGTWGTSPATEEISISAMRMIFIIYGWSEERHWNIDSIWSYEMNRIGLQRTSRISPQSEVLETFTSSSAISNRSKVRNFTIPL